MPRIWKGEAALAEQIVLVGLPGSGKSTVGRILAQRLGWQFVDFDPLLEEEAALPVRDIFAQKGEAEFRRLETELTARLGSARQVVLAPGGGWIVHNQLAGALLVWLVVSPHEAHGRMGAGAETRPLLHGDALSTLGQLLVEREPYYRRAHLQIDTSGKTPEAIADEIASAIQE